MLKKYIKKYWLVIVFFTFCVIISNRPIRAMEEIDAYIVYDKKQVEKGDSVEIAIDLPKFAGLVEAIVRYDYNKELLTPKQIEGNYFYLDSHSIFNSFVMNKLYNEKTLYVEMIKDDISTGYYSSYKNNLCKITFIANKKIDNITTLFDYQNLQIYLFDTSHNLIEYRINKQEKIKGSWINDNLKIDVFTTLPSLEEVFTVENRQKEEYVTFIDKTIDTSIVSTQILQIGVFDVITGDYISYSIVVNVVDSISPTIIGLNEYTVYDTDLDNIDFSSSIEISDNYDHNITPIIYYYDENDKRISLKEAIEKFKKDYVLIVGYVAIDSSQNKTEEFFQKYLLIDTTKPVVTGIEQIIIDDVDLLKVDFTTYFQVFDNLDTNPALILSFFSEEYEPINDIKDYLNINNFVNIEVRGIDKFNNESEPFLTMVKLKDTTPPTIEVDDKAYINDVLVNVENLKKLIKVTDNDSRTCSIDCKYYIEQEESEEEFIKQIKSGKNGKIIYVVKDYTGNMNTKEVQIFCVDTTPPIVELNIQNNEIYESLDMITWKVKDNFLGEVKVETYLDQERYYSKNVSNGKHQFVLIATDENGNITKVECNFIVSDANFIGNVIRGNIQIKKMVYVYVILGISIVLVIVKIVLMRKKQKEKENKMIE